MLFALHDGNEVNGAQRKKQKTGPVARASRTRFWVGSGSGENYHRKETARARRFKCLRADRRTKYDRLAKNTRPQG